MTIRASALNLSRHCSGAHRLARELAEQGVDLSTEHTEQGTAKHQHIEHTLRAAVTLEEEGDETVRWLLEQWPQLVTARLEEEFGADPIIGHPDAYLIHDDRYEVFDWKTGHAGHLPPIAEDWQMLAYAWLTWPGTAPSNSAVSIYRVRIDHRDWEEIHLGGAQLEAALAAVVEVANEAIANADKLRTGRHCDGCLARAYCPAYIQLAEPVALERWRGEALQTHEEALHLARALGPAQALLGRAREALREYGPIYDPTSGKTYETRRVRHDELHDQAVLAALAQKAGPEAALGACKTSKQAVEAALKAHGMAPADIRAWWQARRLDGSVVRVERERGGWR